MLSTKSTPQRTLISVQREMIVTLNTNPLARKFLALKSKWNTMNENAKTELTNSSI